MIEVIYKEDTTEQEAAQESFSMPRNVRQIGLANGDYRDLYRRLCIHISLQPGRR